MTVNNKEVTMSVATGEGPSFTIFLMGIPFYLMGSQKSVIHHVNEREFHFLNENKGQAGFI